jgi:hypothetical protein
LDTLRVRSIGKSSFSGQMSKTWAFLLVYATALAMIAVDLADGVPFVGDVDDVMREVQIRQLMSAQGHWFDLTLPSISMPEAYISPWSRLIDLPYVAIAKLLLLFVPLADAIQFSFYIWPPMLLSVFCLLVVQTVDRLIGSASITKLSLQISLILMTLAMSIGIDEFSSGRIDHHNAQIVVTMMIIAGLVRWDRVGGVMIGVGGALSVVIGLECMPFLATAYAGLIVCHIAGINKTSEIIVSASLAMIAATIASAFAFVGPAGALSTQCDSFSAPYIFLVIGFSVVLAVCAFVHANAPVRPLSRTLALAIPGLAVVVLAALLFPSCVGGPYGIIDPLSRELWFSRIWQERSFIYFYEYSRYSIAALLALTTCFAVLALPMIWAVLRRGGVGPFIAFCVACSALVLTFLVTRNVRFPVALIPVFLPGAVAAFINASRSTQRYQLAALAAVIVAFFGLRLVVAPVAQTFDAVDFMAFDTCQGQDLGILSSVPAGRIALPQGLALPVVMAMPGGFSVGAVPFHRAAPGMKRMFEVFLSSEPDVRRKALAPFDYVAVCRFALKADPAQAPLYAALAGGGGWPGLERVQPPAPIQTNFQLFRIDHSTLQ